MDANAWNWSVLVVPGFERVGCIIDVTSGSTRTALDDVFPTYARMHVSHRYFSSVFGISKICVTYRK